MDNVNQLISIIITTFNRKNYLKEAIGSVLNQTYKNYEIIIIDDCSTDGTFEYIKNYYKEDNIKIYRNEINKGPGINRKYALENYAKGEFVVFLDDDDLFINNDYFKEALELFSIYSDLSMVSASHLVHNVIDNTKKKIEFSYGNIVDNIEFFINFGNSDYIKPIISVTIFKIEALEYSNYKSMKILNDTTIFLRALLFGDMGFINEPSAEYLVHGENISFNMSVDFIIDNLDEKYKLYKLANTNEKFKSKDLYKWFINQCDITIIYYIRGSKPTKRNLYKILRWSLYRMKSVSKIKEYFKIYKESYNYERMI
ncbi:MAG: glycosyltransferase family 2 protein [Bacilli bacterium]|nr:glycosyltransferase family 2 protein [Bacilli bacterium]